MITFINNHTYHFSQASDKMCKIHNPVVIYTVWFVNFFFTFLGFVSIFLDNMMTPDTKDVG